MKKLQDYSFFKQCAIISRFCALLPFHRKAYANFCGFIIILFCPVFIKASAQAIPEDYSNIIKTNVFIEKSLQQWTLTLETRTRLAKQTNNYTIGYNKFSTFNDDTRKATYAMYERRFYASPLFHHLYFFIAPYGKIVYRDVDEAGTWFTPSRYFQSVSVVVGGNAGIQSTVFKRMSLGINIGPGIGLVLWQKSGDDRANVAHLDGLAWLQVGYIF